MGKKIIYVILLLLVGIVAYSFINNKEHIKKDADTPLKPVERKSQFGFYEDEYHLESDIIGNDQFLGTILNEHGINYTDISVLENKAKEIFDVRNIRVGKNYHIVKKDSCDDQCLAFVYEAAPLKYVVYDFRDSIEVKVVDRPYTTCIETVSGTIESSLWNAMMDQGANPAIIDMMEDALASQVSFYHTKKGDRFKAVYEKKMIGDQQVGLGKMLGAYFKNAYGEYYSVYFESEEYGGFYDTEGRPTKKSFLKSPIRAGRISSRYNLRRLHPIKKRRIPHLGTDYAAPYGTPIMAVADGTITVASRKRNNGNYIKILHDDTYSSQYLHMQRFAPGIKPGVRVSQGQTIGYVGSTGLATGPHVCFRFWKNGKQIDHLRENFPPAEPMPAELLPDFYAKRNEVKEMLNAIKFDDKSEDLSVVLEND